MIILYLLLNSYFCSEYYCYWRELASHFILSSKTTVYFFLFCTLTLRLPSILIQIPCLQLISKYDAGAEAEVREWIKALTTADIPAGSDNMHKHLKDGVVLVRYVYAYFYSRQAVLISVVEYSRKNNNISTYEKVG